MAPEEPIPRKRKIKQLQKRAADEAIEKRNKEEKKRQQSGEAEGQGRVQFHGKKLTREPVDMEKESER